MYVSIIIIVSHSTLLFLSTWLSLYNCLSVWLIVCWHDYTFISVCMIVYLSAWFYLCLHACQRVWMFVWLSRATWLSVCMIVFLFAWLYPCLHNCPAICITVSLSPCLYLCLHDCLSTRLSLLLHDCVYMIVSVCTIVSLCRNVSLSVWLSLCPHHFLSLHDCLSVIKSLSYSYFVSAIHFISECWISHIFLKKKDYLVSCGSTLKKQLAQIKKYLINCMYYLTFSACRPGRITFSFFQCK